jgi:rhamnogalacturonyl hydrolase YesR
MFNISAILGRAFRQSGNQKYLEVMKKFLLESKVQQENGLFWHCRSAPYFWSRGNGFAALGFAEALTYLPQDDPQRDALLAMHLKHLEALREIQQPSGMYWQMLDVPGSYQEFTSTCMIGYAMARGLRRGWLDSSFRDSAELAWQGVSERIDDEGKVVDACISTGVQQSVKEYLDRPAVFGLDDRSGALALWFAVEMERLRRGV